MSDSLKNAIQFECKQSAPCAFNAEFKLDKDAVNLAFADALKQAQKFAVLPGFRRGKAPASLVKSRYAEYINEDVEKQIQSAAFDKLTADDKLDIVSFGAAKTEQKPVAGAEYSFSIPIEVAPEIAIPEYKGIELKLDAGESVNDVAAKRLDYLQNLYAEYAQVEGPAEKGDMLKVSFSSDFVLPENAEPALSHSVNSDESWVWLNEPEQFPGVLAALTGAKKGEERSFASVFPADWREPALAGKTVNYKFSVKEIEHKAPITDREALAKKLGVESVDKLDEMIQKDAQDQVEFARKNQARDKMLAFLLEKTPAFELPQGVLASSTEREFSRLAEQLVHKEEDVEPFKAKREEHLETAKKNASEYLRKFFMLRKLARQEKVTVSQQEMDAQISMLSYQTGRKETEIRKIMEQRGNMPEMQAEILMSKVLDKLVGDVKLA